MSLTLVATVSRSTGRPIRAATQPANTSPKLPVGTVKATVRGGAPSATAATGNFGDVFAGWVAARMGLPVDRLTVATNVNDILARTLACGAYELHDVVPTTS